MAAVAQRARSREEKSEVERLFSTFKCMLGYLHKRRSAETLETILFLEINLVLLAREDDIPDTEERDSFGAGH
ncbi:hypothetical protein JG688_00012541 [Phytophthora aleatoria]|uniref:Uncharacterized protein n=1 Tax=Phytophthora aleatoria TaxID=2496075 RepID=A0A8J5IPU6_9STRA|nr:hypothetical protein JG688_00012541 [Phytophthora aleatoria]